jgi:predicted ribosomally synthesized peptide with nif11-like leader
MKSNDAVAFFRRLQSENDFRSKVRLQLSNKNIVDVAQDLGFNFTELEFHSQYRLIYGINYAKKFGV